MITFIRLFRNNIIKHYGIVIIKCITVSIRLTIYNYVKSLVKIISQFWLEFSNICCTKISWRLILNKQKNKKKTTKK